jgi:hypothetical protein
MCSFVHVYLVLYKKAVENRVRTSTVFGDSGRRSCWTEGTFMTTRTSPSPSTITAETVGFFGLRFEAVTAIIMVFF